ncbi:type VI secretion system membrane subunit TssM [Tropicimonas sp.]|uniref:type VI secretion system membrane subunit TssM n=1 Tax=Tropicimonas sp. TaxID=2067044 RepID=UPI003A836521
MRFLASTYFLVPLVTLILSLFFWVFSPFIGSDTWQPFAGYFPRAVVVGIMWFVALVWIAIAALRRGRRDRDMAEEIVEQAADAGPEGDEIVQEELDEMKGKLRGALARLRKSKLGRRHLYELPWYVMIGPPGAGKTTAIVNSGMRFPLAEKDGAHALAGVGGTRNCDWWFTENAVMIDTAGRYTTQESDAQVDNAAWLGFLKLLKKYRPRQPINGAIVAISLSDLSLQDELTRKGHAAAIRRRLNELREQLGVRFPVYVLFTKADLIAGFAESFEPLGKEAREQVWGFTLDLDKSRAERSPTAEFQPEFGGLLQRLNGQLLERMQAETDTGRCSLIAGFPSQVASVRQVANELLAEVFVDSRYEQRHILRGVYFASGTQEGNPIDRLMLGMAQTFGIGRQAIGAGRGSGRSYFLTRLFEGVIFPEAGLVSTDDKVERRYRWTRRLAIAASVLLVAAVGALWTRSYLGNQRMIAGAQAQTAAYQEAAAVIPGNPVGDTDLPAIVPALNILRDMPTNPVTHEADPPLAMGFGLYQGDLVGNAAAQAYRASLNQHLLPRMLLRLDEQMQVSMNDPDRLYEALKVYLMLGLQGPMNRDQVLEWAARDFETFYPGAAREQMRSDLTGHLAALIDQPMQEVALNGHLVESVRQVLRAMPQSDRIYTSIVNSPRVASLPRWRLTDGNPTIGRAMTRSSGAALGDGIAGIYTRCAFHEVFVPEALKVNERLASEAWVMGEAGEAQSEEANVATTAGVFQLYFTDMVQQYEAMLSDLDIIPLDSLNKAVEVTSVLSSPASPIANVLESVADQTRLTQDCTVPENAAAEAGGEALAHGAVRQLALGLSVRQRILKEAVEASFSAAAGGEAQPLGTQVERRFGWLQELVARPEGQPSQLDQYLDLLNEVYQELNKLTFSGGASQVLQNPVIQRFQATSSQMPEPLPRWSTQIAAGAAGIGVEGTRTSVNAEWQSKVLPFCEKALANRYPFTPRAKADVALQDFTRLFAPDGLIDGFFNQHLRDHVDTQADPWVWNGAGGVDLGISPAVLTQFQRAAQIRDTFFAAGPQIAVPLQITPQALDPGAAEMLLEIDGQNLRFAHRDGRPTPVAISWPGQVGMARLTLAPPVSNGESSFGRDGPWALFRLFDAAEVRRTDAPDRKRVIFRIGGRIVIFQVQLGSVNNPFSLAALTEFKCPQTF